MHLRSISFSGQYRDKKILLTGASGFIGRQLIAALAGGGASLTAIVRRPCRFDVSVDQRLGELNDLDFLRNCVRRADPDMVFHLAAFKERLTGFHDFAEAITVNVLGALHVFDALQNATSLERVIVLGTAEEYGANPVPFLEGTRESPVNAYSYSKVCSTFLCEVLHRLGRLPAVVIRPSVAYGPGQAATMFLPALIQSLIEKKPFKMTHGKQTRDFIYVSDLVEALAMAGCEKGVVGETINIGSGSSISIGALALKVQEMMGVTGFVDVGALDYRQGDVMEYSVDIRKAKELMGWGPRVCLEDGLRRTVAYYRGAGV